MKINYLVFISYLYYPSVAPLNFMLFSETQLLMKRFLLFFAISLSANFLTAQITITNNSFPQPGDTLKTAVDISPENIVVGDPGADQTWDFSSLQIPFVRQSIFLDASLGSAADDYPGATMFSEIEIGDSISEAYYIANANKFELMGYVGGDPLGFGLDLTIQLTPPYTERTAPLQYGDFNDTESAASLPIAASELPQELLDTLPFPVDSLRFRLNLKRVGVVDAWGNLTIPGGFSGETYEVLRERRTDIRTIRLDVKVSILPWQDITEFLPEDIRQFGNDTTRTYNYFSNDAKEPIAVVTVDNTTEEVERIEFKANDITSSFANLEQELPSISVSPNPAKDEVNFIVKDLTTGDYQVKIYNLLGSLVWSQDYHLAKAEKRILSADLSALSRGLYLYSLVDNKGKILSTKRLAIQR